MLPPTRSGPDSRHHRARAAAERPAAESAVATTAVLLATTAAEDGLPAAMLPWRGGTIVGHLIEQLAGLGVTSVVVVTRPGWARVIGPALDGSAVPAAVEAGDDVAGDLRAIARAARRGDGPLLVAQAQILTHGQAVAGLLTDPRLGSAILATTGHAGRACAARVRVTRGRVLAAGSPYHRVAAPTASFLGAVKVAAADRAALAAQNERLAQLIAVPPSAFVAELEDKGRLWRETLTDTEAAAARQDAAALTVVSLVRAPVSVGVSYLRGMYWALPSSAAEVAAADEEIDRIDEDDALLDAAVKATDGFFTTFFVSPYSRHIARWAARRGLTPNLVTTVSLLVGIAAAAAFALGDRAGLVTGAVLLQVAFTLDCVDGQLARYTRRFSKFGGWLDSVFDRAKEYLVFAGLAIGSAHMGDPVWVLAGAALTLQTTRHALDFSWAAAQHQRMAAAPAVALDQVGDVAGDPPAPGGATPAPRSVAATLWRTWRRLDRSGTAVWVKRMVQFPIGERFATISLVAALWDPRAVFVVLLAWGALAASYAMAGRLLRSMAATRVAARIPGARQVPLDVYRDEGPLARRVLGPASARIARVPGAPLVLAGLVPLLVVLAVGGAGASHLEAAVAVGWFVVVAGSAAGRPQGRLGWLSPGLLRVGEYAAVLWIAAVAGPTSLPAAFALLAVVAFHQYDLVYRLRHRGDSPPAWTAAIQLGWDGRLALALVLLVAGALPAGLYVWAAVLAVVLAGESIAAWSRPQRAPGPVVDEDDEAAEL